MKKYIVLSVIILFFINSVQAEDLTKFKNYSFKNLFNKSSVTEQNTEANPEENDNLSADAMILYNSNDIDGALKILEEIPEDKRTALDLLLMGNIYQDKKDTDKAASYYQKSILKDSRFYRGYYNLANLYIENDNIHEAIRLYKLAIRNKSDFGYAHYNLGCAYVKIGDLNKAKSSFLRAAEYKKEFPDTYYNLAFVYKKLNNNKKAEDYLKIYNELIARKL